MLENSTTPSGSTRHTSSALNKLDALRDFTGPENQFWELFLSHLAELCAAQTVLLIRQLPDDGQWEPLQSWSGAAQSAGDLTGISNRVAKIAERALQSVWAMESRSFVSAQKDKRLLCALCLSPGSDEEPRVIVCVLPPFEAPAPEYLMASMRLAANLPMLTGIRSRISESDQNMAHFARALEINASLNEKTRHLAACMALCNQVATAYSCSRVSLGWLDKKYVRLQAMSHVERFEKKMEAVQDLEAAMEEAFDQDEEIVVPADPNSLYIRKAHEDFSRKFGSEYVLSLPLRIENEPAGILTCERVAEPFTSHDIQSLALICTQSARRLQDLKTSDVWFGRKLFRYLREKLGLLLGAEHTLAKAASILAACLLGILIFGHWSYRVEAPFTLKAEKLAYITAPFDGFIQDVVVETGDKVRQGSPLLALNTQELVLQETQAMANVQRRNREAEKARAEGKLADMKIALAQVAQGNAKLKQIRYNIDHARIQAPFTGIVVEGEKKELLGRPVHKGDVLFKVAELQGMYAEIEVDERDISAVEAKADGAIAFASRPDRSFPIRIYRTYPVAQPQKQKNIFIAQADPVQKPRTWWRPGMGGIAKINAGERSLLWILTHRTIDFLRMYLWW